MGPRSSAKPGYLDYRPPSFQVLGPEHEQGLDLILAIYPVPTTTTDNPPVDFWVRTPLLRCRTRVSIFLAPDDRGFSFQADPDVDPVTNIIAPDGSGRLGLLWVAEHERGNGDGRKASPVRNVVGTGAAPLSIPTDTRLWGYSFELESNGLELFGRFTPPNLQALAQCASKWHLTVRYESLVPCSTEEWNQFLQQQYIRCQPPEGVVILP